MTRLLNTSLLLVTFTVLSSMGYSQTFEGSITYKIVAHNPFPEKVPDSTWQRGLKEQFGERGYMLQKYYYKKASYISEIDAGQQVGFQAFSPQDHLIYSWQKGTEEAVTVDSRKNMDAFVEFIENEATETILGIQCKSIVLKSKMGQMTLWYNPEHFKMEAKYFKGHVYGHWEQILKELGCLPLKMEQKGFMTHVTQTAIAFKKEPIGGEKFAIPTFKEVTANPIN